MKAQLVSSNEALDKVCKFLQENRLPFKDIEAAKSQIFSYHNSDGTMIGTGGLEFYGDYALLRSVSVRSDLRGKSIGSFIVQDLLVKAKERASEVYLLTETAHDYFRRLDFQDTNRESVPKEVQASTEFSNVCPTSASCMVYKF